MNISATPSEAISATTTGATSARRAERPAARVTTNSEDRARPMKSATVARIMISGRIILMVCGMCSSVIPKT